MNFKEVIENNKKSILMFEEQINNKQNGINELEKQIKALNEKLKNQKDNQKKLKVQKTKLVKINEELEGDTNAK